MQARHSHRRVHLTILLGLVLKFNQVDLDLFEGDAFVIEHIFDAVGGGAFSEPVKSKFHISN